MKLLILFGPPAVGKTTVGQIIEQKTNFRLFHNHMATDGVMHIFGKQAPIESQISRLIRETIITEAANAGINLIFTYVWNFGHEKGKENIDAYKHAYESRGGEVLFVELKAPLDVRTTRAGHPDRFKFKAHTADPGEVHRLEQTNNFQSPQPFFYPEIYTQIDTTNKTPEQIADEIIPLLQ